MRIPSRGVRCLLATAIVLLMAAPVPAQESSSAQLAVEVVKMLGDKKLDSIAAKLGANEYVAALNLAGSQLLVVRARYIVPERMDMQLAAKSYREVYIDLNSASVAGSKTLISDLGANGLQAKPRGNQAADTADLAGKSYSFNGDWRQAKLSEEEYMKAFESADSEYGRMLEALAAELRKPS